MENKKKLTFSIKISIKTFIKLNLYLINDDQRILILQEKRMLTSTLQGWLGAEVQTQIGFSLNRSNKP